MNTIKKYRSDELDALCISVRELCKANELDKCCELIYAAMGKFPHDAIPHNLLGVVLEKKGDHVTAMKHFRAAWDLDPSYKPASQNLHTYGTFFSDGKSAFDESDILGETRNGNTEMVYDGCGVWRLVSRVG